MSVIESSKTDRKIVRLVKDFIEVEDVESFDYEKTKNAVDKLFSKYRNYKNKQDIVLKRYNSSISLDNLGIFSNIPNDPVANKVEMIEKYENFLKTIDKIYELCSSDLSKDERVIYKKCLLSKHTEEELMDDLNMSHGSTFIRKRSCYIKVAKWFDLEVYKS